MMEMLTVISSVATAIGVFLAAWQLWLAHRQSVTNFEDSFAREYRELVSKLPTKALLGESLTDTEYQECFDELYHYFDLCNEQVFLMKRGRITPATWEYWHDGIKSNLHRPAFKRAWREIAAKANSDFQNFVNCVHLKAKGCKSAVGCGDNRIVRD